MAHGGCSVLLRVLWAGAPSDGNASSVHPGVLWLLLCQQLEGVHVFPCHNSGFCYCVSATLQLCASLMFQVAYTALGCVVSNVLCCVHCPKPGHGSGSSAALPS